MTTRHLAAGELTALRAEVARCRACVDLPLGPRPIVQIGARARLLLASQAPGRLAHGSGRPFDDPSGERLRAWLGLDWATFYDPDQVAILPTGLCYPGTGKGGDLPPVPACAPRWHGRLLAALPAIRLTVMIGRHALARHRPDAARAGLTAAVRDFARFLPSHFPLPHPSPRNRPWQHRHPWFATDILPALRAEVRRVLSAAPGDDEALGSTSALR